ncbi:hypothetical protein chiPu_0024269 [Chiloscyllium punctatum]|uniref:Uncharacterized protein n=1 Tax=Chiloscyllium punctatum TaxID=137246 RepID=A0A401TCR1_CHIPU|nr:hypothetical protein [Chiloscyllium punctatum]
MRGGRQQSEGVVEKGTTIPSGRRGAERRILQLPADNGAGDYNSQGTVHRGLVVGGEYFGQSQGQGNDGVTVIAIKYHRLSKSPTYSVQKCV